MVPLHPWLRPRGVFLRLPVHPRTATLAIGVLGCHELLPRLLAGIVVLTHNFEFDGAVLLNDLAK